ncbi:uncharacterized protein LOC124492263 [Dermatophagoides farinae]|uniref:uncharacterized protein LOC124492263 n=1 Tax=Dermatophagoides farinae TaxID=6954 RepID=UPI003F5E961C
MIWQLNYLFAFNIFILIFVSKSPVDSHHHHHQHYNQKLHESQDRVTNTTAMHSMSNINDGNNKEKLMTHSNPPESEHNQLNGDNHNNSLNDIINRRNDVIMNARRIGYHTIMNTFIYTLTLIPLLFTLARTFNTWPNGFIYTRRYKRASLNEFATNTHLPLLNRDETRRFLSLLETTLRNKKILDENCKKYYSCKVIQNAIKADKFPKLSDYEWALLDILGIAVERFDFKLDLVQAVKMYYEIATNALKGVSCAYMYPCLYNHYRHHNKDNSQTNKSTITL